MAIPIDTSNGAAVRWIGAPREEMIGPDSTDWVRPGDVGQFIDFEGPRGDPNVVVTFPAVGALVCSADDVEPVENRQVDSSTT